MLGHYANKCNKKEVNRIEVNNKYIKPFKIKLEIDGTVIKGLIDSGASHSILKKVNIDTDKQKKTWLTLANGI